MITLKLLERPSKAFEVAIVPEDESAYTLNVAGFYQDTVTRDWAMQSTFKATQLAGAERVRFNWYDLNSLSDTGILREAVDATLVADVIMVSVYAADELPPNLYAWVEAWLPRRSSRAGALTALVGVVEPLDSQSLRTIKYLQAVARDAKLDFIPRQRKRTVTSPLRPVS